MKAFRLTGLDGTAEVIEIPIPQPRAGQVRIRLAGAGLCASDLKLLNGSGGYDVSIPLTLGHENSGWIEKLGPEIEGWVPGDAVTVACLGGCGACHNCATNHTQYCDSPRVPGITYDGGLAEYLLADASQLVSLAGLNVAEAAPLADAGLTSYHAVQLCEGFFGARGAIVIIGLGGLGSLAVQIAKAAGWHRIVVVDAVAMKEDRAKHLGASDFFVSGPDLVENVLDAVGLKGVTAVIDLVGIDATLNAAATMVREGGRVVQVGTANGSVPFGRAQVKPGVALVQSRGGNRQDLEAIVQLVRAGQVTCDVELISLDEVAGAYRQLAAGEASRRFVVRFDEQSTP